MLLGPLYSSTCAKRSWAPTSKSLLYFCNFEKKFCIHPLYCGLVPQALRQGMLWEYTLSNHQLWNILRCLWLPEPIHSSAVLRAQRKDKTALHSKWIPHCAGNRKVPHCPAAPSHFSFCYAKSDENELDACTEHFNGTETQQYYLSVGLWEAKVPCQVLLDLEQSVSSVGMATHRYNFHASFVWGLASLQPSAWSSVLAKCLVNLSHWIAGRDYRVKLG